MIHPMGAAPTRFVQLTILAAALTYSPTLLWANRGGHDYGIFMVVMFMLYCVPVGLVLLGCILASALRLKQPAKPKSKEGRIVLVLSWISIPPTVLLPLLLMAHQSWHPEMVELMLADFVPVLLLSLVSVVLATKVRRRNTRPQAPVRPGDSPVSGPLSGGHGDTAPRRRSIRIVLWVGLAVLAAVAFRFWFMG